jgi:hypothetical protein
MMTAMEMHDSVLSSVNWQGSDVILTFDRAYIHKFSKDESEVGTGWAQAVILRLRDCRLSRDLPTLPCEVAGGVISEKGLIHDNVVALPFVVSGDIYVTLEFVTGDTVSLHGKHLSLDVTGDPVFIENVPFDVRKKLRQERRKRVAG